MNLAIAQHRRARVVALIRARAAVSGQRPKNRPRVPRQLQPDAIRAAYALAIRGVVGEARTLVHRLVLPQLGQLVALAAQERGDASSDDVHRVLQQVSAQMVDRLSTSRLTALAQVYALRTSTFQKQQIARQMDQTLGIDVFALPDPGLQGRISQFTAENVSLIRSVATDYLGDVEKRVTAGIGDGATAGEISDDLQDRFDVSARHADLIANDQVGKFYGDLNQARQTNLGVTSYVWRTVEDNRVRSEHADRDGKTFEWDKPPADGHPGEAVNCRCYAEPILSDLIDDASPKEPAQPPKEEPVIEPIEREPVVDPEQTPEVTPEEIAQAQAEIAAAQPVAPTTPAPDYFYDDGDASPQAAKARAELDAANTRMHKVSSAQVKTAGPEVKQSLYDYTANSTRLNAWAGGSYDYTRDHEFTSGAKTKAQIAKNLASRMKRLDRSIKKTAVPETMHVYRAMELDSLAPSLPHGQFGSIDRTTTAAAEKATRLSAFVGQTFTDPVFASTSIDYNVAQRFMRPSRVLLRIRVPEGAPGMFYDSDRDLTKFIGERELLLERRSQFEVVGVHQKPGAGGSTVTMLDVVYVGLKDP